MEHTQFFFDVDSTIIRRESLQDMVSLALESVEDAEKRAMTEQELISITNAGMNGEIDFAEALKRRLALAPVTKAHMNSVTTMMLEEITEGMQDFIQSLREAGHGTWILTAGIREMMLPLAKKLGIPPSQVLANEPVWIAGRLQDFEPGPLLRTDGKGTVVRSLRASGAASGRVIMIGDGMSDLGVFTSGAADDFFGYGEHAVRKNVKDKAPHFFMSVADMRSYVGI